MSDSRCPCGADHSGAKTWSTAMAFVRRTGESMPVTVAFDADGAAVSGMGTLGAHERGRTWLVPRLWIWFHGLNGRALPELAARYGWAEIVREAPNKESNQC